MRLKDGLTISQIDEDYILIDVGNIEPVFNGMIKLNITAKEICEALMEKDVSLDELIDIFTSQYEVNKKDIAQDINEVLDELDKAKLLIK